jgi:DNA polymerase-1
MSDPVCIDFETFGIEQRPDYPPQPVGVSIKWPGRKPVYYAWGHPSGNNCELAEARSALAKAWEHPGGILCHNAKFDLDVAETHLGMPRLPWGQIHDTMFLLFLEDPHAPTFALKPAAAKILGMEPEEQADLQEWLIGNKLVTRASKNWGAFIAYAPGDLVGRYANGDVDRTAKLYKHLMKSIKARKMAKSYDRERELMLILLDNERRGIPVDLPRLKADVATYDHQLELCSEWILKRLKARKVNLDSGQQLLEALKRVNAIDLSALGMTATGLYRTDKASLAQAVTSPVLGAMLAYRASLQTCLGTFMKPWLATAEKTGGRIHTGWNQVRSSTERKGFGAVTGRLSSSPNFQNIPNEFPAMFHHEKAGLPKTPIPLAPLPHCRDYIVPEKGCALVGRDYSQQELRVLAHYAGGDLLEAYLDNPTLDLHQHAAVMIAETLQMGALNPDEFKAFRKRVKTTGFGLIYGMGVRMLAEKTGLSYDEAKVLKNAYLRIFPGLTELTETMKQRAAADEPIRTWGGREYYCEPAEIVGDRLRTFEYKMINVLVQGSSADCTKQAVIEFYRGPRPEGCELMLTVHDELLLSVPRKFVKEAHVALNRAMKTPKFNVPMLSDGKTSLFNWSSMEPFNE